VRDERDPREGKIGTLPAELRIALIGCGEVCEHKHLRALRRVRGARVVAVADTDPYRLAHVADRFGIARRYADVRDLLDDGEADIVGVLVPPAQHAEVALAALGAGVHVLVEKPLALTLDEADALVAAGRDSRGRVLMGFHMRWHRLVRKARTALAGSVVGTPESIRTTWNSPRGDDGTPEWKWQRATGGGALVELAVHLFDLWRYLLNTEVVELFVLSRNGRRNDENAVVCARLASGALATATISERTSHSIELEVCGDRGRLAVSGQRFDGFERFGLKETNGMLRPRVRAIVGAARELPRGLARMRTLGDYGDSYRGQWQHFVDAIGSNAPAECTLEDGRAALRVVLAATESARLGRPVMVGDALRSIAPSTTNA
jgi:myo-inositol 2-dehydrogenase / D-chiro-inositol 1-dehydrogenase